MVVVVAMAVAAAAAAIPIACVNNLLRVLKSAT